MKLVFPTPGPVMRGLPPDDNRNVGWGGVANAAVDDSVAGGKRFVVSHFLTRINGKRQPSLRDRLPKAERSVQSVSLQIRNFRIRVLAFLGMVGILSVGWLSAADPVRLELVRGEEAAETLPQAVGFRFELRAYVMPLADGEFEFGLSPYAPPGEATEAADFAVTASLVDGGTEAELESITATEADTKMTVRLQANRMYRLDLASLRNGLAADRSGKVVFPSGLAVALEATADRPAWVEGLIGAIFVPPGTTEIACFGEPRLSLISPSKQRTDLGMAQVKEDGLARLPVDPGEDGRFWVVGNQTRGKVFFAGAVPGWINVNQADLLLPKGGE